MPVGHQAFDFQFRPDLLAQFRGRNAGACNVGFSADGRQALFKAPFDHALGDIQHLLIAGNALGFLFQQELFGDRADDRLAGAHARQDFFLLAGRQSPDVFIHHQEAACDFHIALGNEPLVDSHQNLALGFFLLRCESAPCNVADNETRKDHIELLELLTHIREFIGYSASLAIPNLAAMHELPY